MDSVKLVFSSVNNSIIIPQSSHYLLIYFDLDVYGR